MSDHRIHVGTDGVTEYLLTTWADGTTEVATRPMASTQSWSPPTRLTELYDGVQAL